MDLTIQVSVAPQAPPDQPTSLGVVRAGQTGVFPKCGAAARQVRDSRALRRQPLGVRYRPAHAAVAGGLGVAYLRAGTGSTCQPY